MARPTLIIGNKNYSGWSLGTWLGLRHAGMDFTRTLPLPPVPAH